MATRRPKPRRKRTPRNLAADLIEFANEGEFSEIVARCRFHEESQPLSAKCLHLWGIAEIQLNNFTGAIDILKRASLVADDDANALAIQADLAKAYFSTADPEPAVAILEELIRFHPEEIELYRNLTRVLEKLGRVKDAIAVAGKACFRWPFDSALFFQLGDLYIEDQQYESAASALAQCIESDPDHLAARRRLVRCYRQLGNENAVRETLQNWHDYAPDDEVVAHLLAAQTQSSQSQGQTPKRASDGYVRNVFDQFADTFDAELQSLNYRGPQEIATLLADLDHGSQPWNTLDAGCGTGLMGEYLRNLSDRLVGVDLSPKMLASASGRGYDALVEQELVSFLQCNPDSFDLIVSADTLNYFGDLKSVFIATHKALRKSAAAFAFSLEKHSGSSSENYRLNPNGRYSHDAQYVHDLLQECGFDIIKISEAPLRTEASATVIARFYLVTKQHS